MKLTKDKKHSHYWIEDGILGESYHTLRGLRYRGICEIDLPDNPRVSYEELEQYDPCKLPEGQTDKEEVFQSFPKDDIQFKTITKESYDGH